MILVLPEKQVVLYLALQQLAYYYLLLFSIPEPITGFVFLLRIFFFPTKIIFQLYSVCEQQTKTFDLFSNCLFSLPVRASDCFSCLFAITAIFYTGCFTLPQLFYWNFLRDLILFCITLTNLKIIIAVDPLGLLLYSPADVYETIVFRRCIGDRFFFSYA